MSRRVNVGMTWVLLLTAAMVWGCDNAGSSSTPTEDGVLTDLADTVSADDSPQTDLVPEQDIPDQDPYTGEAGAVPSFQLTSDDFFDLPFPIDSRRSASGRVNLDGFPNPYKIPLVDQYIQKAEDRLDGFSPNGTIYFHFDAALDSDQFPSLQKSMQEDAGVQLVNVTKGSPSYGQRIPIELFYWDKEAPVEGYYLRPYLLMARPLGGFPLAAGETYACVVLRTTKDAQGKNLAAAPVVQDALVRAQGDAAKLLDPLRSWILEAKPFSVWDVSVATVFTTSVPTKDLERVARYLKEEGTLELVQPPKLAGDKYGLTQFVGVYRAPNFMHGDAPYDKGGDFKFGDDGKPLVDHMEDIPFTIGIPMKREGMGPVWPVVEMSHGTGGDRFSFVYDGSGYELGEKGMATISIDQPLHGDRYTGPSVNVELYSFNFTNPSSGRTLFQQAALDNVALTKILGQLEFEDAEGVVHSFDTSKVGYFGHSQGGITGALFVAVEDGIQGAVLSGAGGGLAYTILLRKEIDSGAAVDIKQMVATMLKLKYADELDLFHPVMTLIQMLVDVTDPINYTPHYFYPRFREKPLPLFMTSGIDDPYTPAITAENMAIAGGIPQAAPVLHNHPGFALKGMTPVALPAKGNLAVGDGGFVTAVMAQFDGYGHFPIFDDDTAISMYTNFMATTLFDGKPEVPAQ